MALVKHFYAQGEYHRHYLALPKSDRKSCHSHQFHNFDASSLHVLLLKALKNPLVNQFAKDAYPFRPFAQGTEHPISLRKKRQNTVLSLQPPKSSANQCDHQNRVTPREYHASVRWESGSRERGRVRKELVMFFAPSSEREVLAVGEIRPVVAELLEVL